MNFGPNGVSIPKELSTFFSEEYFDQYPKITTPQIFHDERGIISNIADGVLGDVAVITSNPGSVRANHVHKEDWHLSYLVYGEMLYKWQDVDGVFRDTLVSSGNLIYTPPKVPHRMEFNEDSCFIASLS